MTITPRIAVLRVGAPLEHRQVPELIERTCALLSSGEVDVLSCEVAGVGADAVAVEALARLALAARRSGCRTRLSGASEELLDLVCFMGLAEVLGS